MSISFERKMLIVTALLCAATAVGCLVLTFKMQAASESDANRARLNRYLICHALKQLNAKQPLCDDIDPPTTAPPRRTL